MFIFYCSILYQLGLQDVFVFYTGGPPITDIRSYMDVAWSIGERVRSLTQFQCTRFFIMSVSQYYRKGVEKVLDRLLRLPGWYFISRRLYVRRYCCIFVGARSSPLTPGYDCPQGAVYVDSTVFADGTDDVINIKNALCIFEYRWDMLLIIPTALTNGYAV